MIVAGQMLARSDWQRAGRARGTTSDVVTWAPSADRDNCDDLGRRVGLVNSARDVPADPLVST